LVRAGDKQAVPVLVDLLGEGPIPLGWRAQELLYRIAGDKGPAEALAEDDRRKRAAIANAWRGWWKAAEPTTQLASINLDEALQGINVICEEANNGRVWACRADGKPLWEIKGVMAWDAQLLPNGRVLIAEHNAGQVTERELTGKVLWTKRVGNSLTSCRRLPNGNTFIGSFGEVTEVDPKGTTVYSYKHPTGGLMARAHRLRNGHLVFAVGGDKVVEVDAKFQDVRTLKVPPNGDSWISVEPLSGERVLIAPYGAGKVYESDSAGKILWECSAPTPMSAVRLPNGNTLVSSNTDHSVIEYDRSGKEVWKLKCQSSVRCVRRY
jgi:outer membrane protein assembly factor BamB